MVVPVLYGRDQEWCEKEDYQARLQNEEGSGEGDGRGSGCQQERSIRRAEQDAFPGLSPGVDKNKTESGRADSGIVRLLSEDTYHAFIRPYSACQAHGS